VVLIDVDDGCDGVDDGGDDNSCSGDHSGTVVEDNDCDGDDKGRGSNESKVKCSLITIKSFSDSS